MECEHKSLTIEPDLGTNDSNVYTCDACGVLGHRLWTRRGLLPFVPYVNGVAKVRDSKRSAKFRDLELMQRMAEQDERTEAERERGWR